MALIVGNLLTDPAANSFISLLDAEAYLADEGAGADLTTPLGRWFVLDPAEKESSLVRASRWLAAISTCQRLLSCCSADGSGE